MSFIQARKSLREFRPSAEFESPHEPEIFEALTEQAASLEVLELFSNPNDIYRTVDPRLTQFGSLFVLMF